MLAWRGWPWLVDAAGLALVLLLSLSAPGYLPVSSGCSPDILGLQLRCGWNAFLLSGCNLFFGAMLLGGCSPSGARSLLVRLANTSALSDVGNYSFNIYLLQGNIARLFLVLQNLSSGECAARNLSVTQCAKSIEMYSRGPLGSLDSLWWSAPTAAPRR